MTLEELYNLAIKNGCTKDAKIIIRYHCDNEYLGDEGLSKDQIIYDKKNNIILLEIYT